MTEEDVEKLKVHEALLTSENVKVYGEVRVDGLPEKHEGEHEARYDVTLRGDHELAAKSVHWKLTEIRKEPSFDGTSRLLEVRTERVPDAAAKELLAQAGVAIGDVVTEDSAEWIRRVAQKMDEHYIVAFHQDRKAGGIVVTIGAH